MNAWPLQEAIYSRLTGSSALAAFVGPRIYDDVPQTTPFPYVVVGDDMSIPWDQDACAGTESTVTLHVWSRYSGRKEAKQILAVLYALLHNAELTVSGSQTVLFRAEYQETFLDPDGMTRHGVIRFRTLFRV